jgi:hypothetical protein
VVARCRRIAPSQSLKQAGRHNDTSLGRQAGRQAQLSLQGVNIPHLAPHLPRCPQTILPGGPLAFVCIHTYSTTELNPRIDPSKDRL